MKIKKKAAVKACTSPLNEAMVTEEVAVPSETVNTSELGCQCKYDDAIQLIMSAIESLAEVAKDDEIAKDSIANLGVVMLDLKGGC